MRTSAAVAFLAALTASTASAAELTRVTKVELQPLAAQAGRIAVALDILGAPLPAADKKALAAAGKEADQAKGIAAFQAILDKHCLAEVQIPVATDKPLHVVAGPVAADLAEQGWRVYLVKVINPAGIDKVDLRPTSPNALPLTRSPSVTPTPKVSSVGETGKRFLELLSFQSQPLLPTLSGLEVEYRIVQLYCRDAGRKEITLGFSLWTPTEKDGPRPKLLRGSDSIRLVLDSVPAVLVRLQVLDHDGKPAMASFTFRDKQDRVFPAPTRRLAPDFSFHPQVYRKDSESIALQPGTYTVTCTRGPEYVAQEKTITVPAARTHTESFRLQRWIHPATRGWYSGDHHIHAAGCKHYESPTEGVTPADMMRHVLGEDVNVGCCLSWGPCWYHQKRYFEGKVNALSTPSHLLRYDVEVSGFPSSHCGHVCLLRLRQQDYPGTKLIEDWPSWDLPVLKWAKSQGAVVGFAHSGSGLAVGPKPGLPNYVIPPMNGIGANEYLVDVAHDAIDFISTVDTQSTWELNIWYHTLNCGYRCRISGETDFPCVYGQKVGMGRSYVHLAGKLDFDKWCEGIKLGRCYVGDGKSHLMDFKVNGLGVGEKESEIALDKPGNVQIEVNVAARLEPNETKETKRIRGLVLTTKPYWDIERCRIGSTRKVPVEVVVNGLPVARKEIVADGSMQKVTFEVPIKQSSWVCLRILPSSHTNPIFVLVDKKPIRASKRSAEWCLKSIDQCWSQKKGRIRPKELPDAQAAYDQARAAYRKIAAESP